MGRVFHLSPMRDVSGIRKGGQHTSLGIVRRDVGAAAGMIKVEVGVDHDRDVIGAEAEGGDRVLERGASVHAPFQGGTLCVAPPLVRTAPGHSGGNSGAPDCSGSYRFEFSHAYLTARGIHAGDRVHAQFWARDPMASFGVGLTDAVAFDVQP
jgi:hypothetical protein